MSSFTKVCKKCNLEKDTDDYFIKDKKTGRRSTYCKQCTTLINNIYKENNKEKIREYKKKWSQDNKEKLNKYSKQWAKDNKGKRRKANKKWYGSNKEKISQLRIENIERYRRYNLERKKKNRRVLPLFFYIEFLERKLRGAIQHKRKSSIWNIIGTESYDSFIGIFPETLLQQSTIDHIFPLSRCRTRWEVLSLHNIKNMQILSRSENASKGNKIIPKALEIYRELLGYDYQE